jgi:hypothetical protein
MSARRLRRATNHPTHRAATRGKPPRRDDDEPTPSPAPRVDVPGHAGAADRGRGLRSASAATDDDDSAAADHGAIEQHDHADPGAFDDHAAGEHATAGQVI